MTAPRTSVIATTYNQSQDLELYLASLARQTMPDFEIIIADDGSREETRAVIDRARAVTFGDRLVHVWHEDAGYRKCKILNSAVRKARGSWLVFTDSDLIVHPHFVADHSSVQEPNSIFMGRRVDLAPAVSEWIRSNPSKLFSAEFYARVIASGFFGETKTRNFQRSFRVESGAIAEKLGHYRVPDLLGSNFSIDRELLMRVNGFNEALEHYWGEDGDLFVRVRNTGAKISGRKNFAVQFHLWHKMRSPQAGAEAAYRKSLENKTYVRCEKGLA